MLKSMAKRLLLVEDEAIIAMSEAQILTRHGYEVVTARSGEEALEAVDSDRDISLVLMDIDLGTGMDGTEAAERILEGYDLPIAFLSSHTEPGIVERTEGISSYGYIVKNSGETVLIASIKMAYRLHEAYLELKRQKEDLDQALEAKQWSEKMLLEKSEELERYFASSLDLLCIANTGGEFLRLNPQWEHVLGYSGEELEGRAFMDFVHDDDKDATLQALSQLERQEELSSFENRYRCRDGSYRWIEWRSKPVGNTVYAVARDISRRKETEQRLREEQDRLQSIIDKAPLLINEIDAGGHYTMVNNSTCAFLKRTKEQIIGKHFEAVFPRETAALFQERVDHVSRTGEALTVDDTLHIDQKRRVFRTVLFPLCKNGEALPSIVGIGYEITEQTRLNEEKDFLMRELNHRTKNNLYLISSLISLKGVQTDTDLSDLQHQIHTLSLIHEKLHQTGNVSRIHFREYIADLLGSIFCSLTTRKVKVDDDIEDFHIAPKSAIALGLIINEIATNAIKHGFSDDTEAEFSIRLKKQDSRYELTLSNSGSCFPEEMDLDNPQTLGLQLIASLVSQLYGTIALTRRPRTLFTICFPANEEKEVNGKQKYELP